MSMINRILKRRFAARWLDAVAVEDVELPNDDELLELVEQEQDRRWEADCRRMGLMKLSSGLKRGSS